MSTLEQELKELIISILELEDIQPAEIDSAAALFGEGLGLDSIDALELGLAIKKKYNVRLNAESAETKKHFYSVQSLAALIASTREN